MSCKRTAKRTAPSLAKLARAYIVALGVIAAASAAPHPATAGEAPAAFINTLGDRALAVIRSDAPLAQKAAYFRQMLRQDFDITGISRFVLGPYWRVASAAQQQEFRNLFEDDLLHFYGRRLAQYDGESFRVTGSRSNPDGAIVESQLIRPQGPPIEIDWRLGVRDGLYKIDDVAIEGVSMALARRSEFAAVIERDGGQIEGLINLLRWKVG